MHVRVAIKTLQSIDEVISKDQGSLYRKYLGQVLPHIEDAYREGNDGHRSHMGASLIGGECPRAIWYDFHWVTKSAFPGRIMRLFNRGHLEEGRFIAMLLAIGCRIYQQDEHGNQFRVSHAGGHFGGSGDGVAIGLPDLTPLSAALTEFKTHGEKSFIELAGKLDQWRKHVENPSKYPFTGKGVREAKFEHYVQMQVYMFKMGLPLSLYLAVNKNTDDLYGEIVLLDRATAEQFLDRGTLLIDMPKPPKRISESPGFFKCRFCSHRDVCHLNKAPDVNCRTCIHSHVSSTSPWTCDLHGELSRERQLVGCKDYKRNHDL